MIAMWNMMWKSGWLSREEGGETIQDRSLGHLQFRGMLSRFSQEISPELHTSRRVFSMSNCLQIADLCTYVQLQETNAAKAVTPFLIRMEMKKCCAPATKVCMLV